MQAQRIAELEEQKISVYQQFIANVRAYEDAIVDMEPVDDLLSERDRLERLNVSLEDQIRLLKHRSKNSPKIKDLAKKALSDITHDLKRKSDEYTSLLSKLEDMREAYIDALKSELRPVMTEIAYLRRKAMEASFFVRNSAGEIVFISTPLDQLQPSRKIAPFFFNNDQIAIAISGYDSQLGD